MIKVKILSINDYYYDLLDRNGNLYNKNIGFNNISVIPNVGDYMYLTEEILQEDNIYTFGPLNSSSNELNSSDIIKIVTKDDQFFLRRLYG